MEGGDEDHQVPTEDEVISNPPPLAAGNATDCGDSEDNPHKKPRKRS